MSFLKKPVAHVPVADGARSAVGGAWDGLYPALLEFLGATAWEDGSPRTTGSVTLFVEQGVWKLCLNDRDQARVAFVSAADPLAVLSAADQGLTQDSLDWRMARSAAGGPRRK